MTDVGEQAELLRLIQARPAGVRVFCIGVGNEVNRPLLEQLAQQAGGLAAFVSTEDSFARQAQLMRQKLVRPAIEELSVQFDGGAIEEVEPTQLGDLFYGTPLRLFGRYGTSGTVRSRSARQGAGAPGNRRCKCNCLTRTKATAKSSGCGRPNACRGCSLRNVPERDRSRTKSCGCAKGIRSSRPMPRCWCWKMMANTNDGKFNSETPCGSSAIARRESVQVKLTELCKRNEESFEVERAEKLVTAQDPASDSANVFDGVDEPLGLPQHDASIGAIARRRSGLRYRWRWWRRRWRWRGDRTVHRAVGA